MWEDRKERTREVLETGLAVFGIVLVWTMLAVFCKREQMQQDISDAVIRFHVVANSDSREDQAVKYEVRDAVLKEVQRAMETAGTKAEAEEVLELGLGEITETANRVLSEQGMEYQAMAVLETTGFPVKTYGDLTFPAGNYEAVNVYLGEGSGQNWWCVMFPTLCLVDGTCETVPEESKEKLKNSLTQKEYQSLLKKQKKGGNVEYRFRLKEWLSEILG